MAMMGGGMDDSRFTIHDHGMSEGGYQTQYANHTHTREENAIMQSMEYIIYIELYNNPKQHFVGDLVEKVGVG
jgi:hypothetical protein